MKKYMIVPIFSMRSYETGKFAVLKDGNFQLHLHRAPKNSVICVPKNSSDLDELRNLFPEFMFMEIEYQHNAAAIREEFWKSMSFVIDLKMAQLGCNVLVTDIPVYSGLNAVIYNFNISYDPKLQRPYVDNSRSQTVNSVNWSVRTFVLNECQKEQLIIDGADESKIIVSKQVLSRKIMSKYSELAHLTGYSAPFMEYFHPFRISDPCYKFSCVVSDVTKDLDKIMYITDPNNTFAKSPHASNESIVVIRPSKAEYYKLLMQRPKIFYHEDPQRVFHPGLAELIYYGCDIISAHKIPSYNDVIVSSDDFWSGQ